MAGHLEACLDDSKAKIETIVIPGGRRRSSPITVKLPIIARPRRWANVSVGLSLLIIGLMFLLEFWAALSGLLSAKWPSKDFFIFLVFTPTILFYGSAMLFSALSCFWDALRSNHPHLEITADGLRDHRSGLSVPWSSVRCAQNILNRGSEIGLGVELTFDPPATYWQNPFRLGLGLNFRFRPKPGRVRVSAGFLDVDGDVLLWTIMMLVQWHGGQTLTNAWFLTPPEPFLTVHRVDSPNGSHLEYVPRVVSQK